MKNDVRNVLLTLIVILIGAFSASIIYAKQLEIENISYNKAIIEAELARLKNEYLEAPIDGCIAKEEVNNLVISRLKEIEADENSALLAEESAKNELLQEQQAIARTQAEITAAAAKKVQQEEARLATEKIAAEQAIKIAAEKKAAAQAEADKAAALAAAQAAAKKASRQSRAS